MARIGDMSGPPFRGKTGLVGKAGAFPVVMVTIREASGAVGRCDRLLIPERVSGRCGLIPGSSTGPRPHQADLEWSLSLKEQNPSGY